jgi:hypothetical protein
MQISSSMYGIIMQNAAEYIQVVHGLEKWKLVKEHFRIDWVGKNTKIQSNFDDPKTILNFNF